jgi:uncharacterized protein (DUF2384 family)
MMLSPLLAGVEDRGLLSPRRVSDRLRMPVAQLARLARLHRNTLSHPESALVQTRLGEIVTILAKAAELGGDPDKAVVWFRHQPIAAFGNQTAEELVAAGHGEAVLGHLDDLRDGAYA